MAELRRVGFGRRHAQRRTNVVQRVFALGVEIDQPRFEVVPALLQIDAARNAAVAHRVGSAGVGIARIGNSLDRSGKRVLGRLFAERETPLERPLRRFHDPRRVNRRHLRLGAHVVQHHEQDVFSVVTLGAWLAVLKAVHDKRAGVDIPCFAVLDAGLVRQERREGCLRHAVAVIDNLAVHQRGRLAQQQGCFAIGVNQPCYELDKFGAILTHRFAPTCHNGSLS